MTDLLIVIDMQRDFVSGALGSPEARAITPAVPAKDAFSPFRTASAIRRAGRLNRKSPPNVRRI